MELKYSDTRLYNLKRKRDLKKILNVSSLENYIEKANICYSPYIDKKAKPRLIENPNNQLKIIQRRIKKYLFELTYPDNVFSGIPGRSYIDNAKYHQNSNYFIKIDISKFFPNTHREKVYNFYKEKLIMSSDIAEIMTNLSTVNLSKISNNEVKDFVIKKEIKASNHLPSGSPISCVVSFLANFEMFNEIEKICLSNNCKVSFYIDDVTISSTHKIPKTILRKIKAITKKHFHEINMDKSKTYLANDYKKITGCIVSKEKELIVPNKIKYKIRLLKNNKYTIDKKINSVLGLINTAQIFEKQKYASLKYDITKKLT